MYQIPEISRLNPNDLQTASRLLEQVKPNPIAFNNWSEDFPYQPQAGFRMAHNGQELFIRFSVREECTLAKITADNGEVWTDSCVEFFLTLDDSGYYNFEFSCIGKALLGFRKERPHAVHAPQETMETIRRYSTLGKDNFEETQLNTPWELTVAIPATALFRHQLKNWKGLSATMNLYKCGDNLSKPHYLSWQPIDTGKPDFHVPRCFIPVCFI